MTDGMIDAKTALAIQKLIEAASGTAPPRGTFRCPKCGEPVFPQGGENLRFNHWTKNPDCTA